MKICDEQLDYYADKFLESKLHEKNGMTFIQYLYRELGE